ncbi:MAG: DUF3842 family protein [Saccharofermentanales bacterium]
MKKLRILVVDGQGGGMGRAIVERLRREFNDKVELHAVGTNAIAAQAMMKAGADAAASGESAVIYNSQKADYIIGPIGILAGGSMLGELSPAMAQAITASSAEKILLPLNRCGLQVVGIKDEPLQIRLDQLSELVRTNIELHDTNE